MTLAMVQALTQTAPTVMADKPNFTAVQLQYRKSRINHRLYFGAPRIRIRLDWQRSLAVFQPADIFGYIRWRANQYGTQHWSVFVVQACSQGPMTALPGIAPGADLLLHVSGKSAVKRLLLKLETSQLKDLDLPQISPAYWRHLHLRLGVGDDPHGVSDLQRKSVFRHVERT